MKGFRISLALGLTMFVVQLALAQPGEGVERAIEYLSARKLCGTAIERYHASPNRTATLGDLLMCARDVAGYGAKYPKIPVPKELWNRLSRLEKKVYDSLPSDSDIVAQIEEEIRKLIPILPRPDSGLALRVGEHADKIETISSQLSGVGQRLGNAEANIRDIQDRIPIEVLPSPMVRAGLGVGVVVLSLALFLAL